MFDTDMLIGATFVAGAEAPESASSIRRPRR